jgi:hypothetical protein
MLVRSGFNFQGDRGIERSAPALAAHAVRLRSPVRDYCLQGCLNVLAGEAVTGMGAVIQTCRAQGRSALKFLHQAMMAHYADTDIEKPSLIPVLDT